MSEIVYQAPMISVEEYEKYRGRNVALDEGADPVRLGLPKPGDREHAYIQCVDPGEPYTDGGTVIFKIKRVKQKGQSLKVEEEG